MIDWLDRNLLVLLVFVTIITSAIWINGNVEENRYILLNIHQELFIKGEM